MKKPVWLRARVEDELRRDFKGVTKSLDYAPAEAVRLFMARLVQLSQKSRAKNQRLQSNAMRDASDDVAKAMGIGRPEPACGEEGDAQRARD